MDNILVKSMLYMMNREENKTKQNIILYILTEPRKVNPETMVIYESASTRNEAKIERFMMRSF